MWCEASFASEKQRTAAPKAKLASLRVRGPAPSGSATLLVEPKPQTPFSALRGRQGMDIMDPRWPSESMLSLEAWREFSWRLKVLGFIEGAV